MKNRTPLSIERIVQAAVEVADEGGLPHVSMRRVAGALGVEAMSLYHHVSGKDALLDALAEWCYEQIDLPDPTRPWREAMADRARSARAALARHPWSVTLIESRRNPGPALLTHHDRVLETLRRNGFSIPLAAHVFSVLDAYVYGFVISEQSLPVEDDGMEPLLEHVETLMPSDEYPYLAELMQAHVRGRDYAYGEEFEFGLELILDGIARHR